MNKIRYRNSLYLRGSIHLFVPDARKPDSLEKNLMLGKTEGRRKGATEDKTVGWHHWCDGHEFEQPLAIDDGRGKTGRS